jgi:uncharacterized protein (UPF0212 family)
MPGLSPLELLDAWERGLGQRPNERALTLLAATDSQNPRDALAKLSIGRRDAGLLSLREELFGSLLSGLADCPRCGERLDLSFNIADIQDSSVNTAVEGPFVTVQEWRVEFRLPNSDDLLALSDCKDVGAGRALLLRRCILNVEKDREASDVEHLPANVIEAVAQAMAEADALGDVQLALTCPQCGHAWQAPFDIASFLWTEINAWAHRTLQDVHELARAYGWREADILALSPWRRQVYLEMISQ